MKKWIGWGIVFLCIYGCTSTPSDSDSETIELAFTIYEIPASIRALEIQPDGTVWYGGSDGLYGYTENNGQDWHHDSLFFEGKAVEFRSLASTKDAMLLQGTNSPALIFRSTDKGQSWNLVYRENHPDCYYNALAFWNDEEGVAVGDPTDGCLSVITTRDGGQTWQKLACDQLPPLASGEAGFAASNTNIAISGDHAWLVTGGAKARVFHTPDRGKTWDVADTPINQGGKMTGIYSVAFWDQDRGMLFGGDWENKSQNTKCKAHTVDGGKTWKLLNDGQEPAFRSCVQYVPGSDGQQLFAVGSPGISYSSDGGETWDLLSKESFYTIRIAASGKEAWLAGKNRVARMAW